MPRKVSSKSGKRCALSELTDCGEGTSNIADSNNEETDVKRAKLEMEDEGSTDVDDPEEMVDDPSPANDEKSGVTPAASQPKKKTSLRWPVLKKIEYEHKCEWKDCDYKTIDADQLISHVKDHIPALEIKKTEDPEAEVYVCLWEKCDAEIDTPDEAVRHVYFHGFHTKLKGIGARFMNDEGHPHCQYSTSTNNLILELPSPFMCFWEDCSLTFQNAQYFYNHVYAHAVCLSSGNSKRHSTPIFCQWRGCRTKSRGLQALKFHIRTHTKEKALACPTCGALFANCTRFYDHCSRQLPKSCSQFQCSHCDNSYPTERLLRDHMRQHINSYKCPFCEMTSPTPGNLSLHIRNRHMSERPFKCEYCSHSAKTQYNLISHMSTHYSGAVYECSQQDCSYRCRSITSFRHHIRTKHALNKELVYCCHMCDNRYMSGQALTKHLVSKHNYRLPSGHSRFRYKSDNDGLYRLETVRYESLDVTQEIINVQSNQEQPNSMVILTEPSTSQTNVPNSSLFVAYDTLDEFGKVVTKLVGVGQTVPVKRPEPILVVMQRDPSDTDPLEGRKNDKNEWK